MWFKNIVIYRLIDWNFSANQLEEFLGKYPLQACHGLVAQSKGWIPPREPDQSLVHKLDSQLLISLGIEKKLLPASVVRQQTKARAAEIEQTQGFKAGRKQLKEIKEAITDELLPKAFSVRRQTNIWIDPVNNWLVVDAAGIAKADEVTEMLNKTLENINFKFLRTKLSPSSAMKNWLLSGSVPAQFTIDQDCELKGVSEGKSSVRYTGHSLDEVEIGKHIKSGMDVKRLALTWNDRVSFLLQDNLQLKRITPQDIVKEQTEQLDEYDVFDTNFALMTGLYQRLFEELAHSLGEELE